MRAKIVLFFAIVIIAAQLSQPMFATPITYTYTGNPFTFVQGAYTTSDKVTGSVTLSSPLVPNMVLTMVTPLAFSFFDGFQTFTNSNADIVSISFATGPTGAITQWDAVVAKFSLVAQGLDAIGTGNPTSDNEVHDFGQHLNAASMDLGLNVNAPGVWSVAGVSDAGSTFAMLSLSFTALGVATRQFKRAAT
jgi:hypothetical protein